MNFSSARSVRMVVVRTRLGSVSEFGAVDDRGETLSPFSLARSVRMVVVRTRLGSVSEFGAIGDQGDVERSRSAISASVLAPAIRLAHVDSSMVNSKGALSSGAART